MTIIPALGISGRQIPFLNLLRSDCDQFKVDLGIGREFAQLAFDMLGGMCATRIAIKECIDVYAGLSLSAIVSAASYRYVSDANPLATMSGTS